jgi:hypothetical protein
VDETNEEMSDIDFGLDDKILDGKPDDIKIFDDSSEDDQNETSTTSRFTKNSCAKPSEIAKLEALEAIKSHPAPVGRSGGADIDFGLDDEIIDGKPGDNKVFNDIDFGLDDEILDGKPDSNHPINARTEGRISSGILVQA